jgi:DoxX-like family
MDANVLLWIGQILLALAFATVAYGHSLGFDSWSLRPGFGWLQDLGRGRMRILATLEGLGAIGLIVPAATGILPLLTPGATSPARSSRPTRSRTQRMPSPPSWRERAASWL